MKRKPAVIRRKQTMPIDRDEELKPQFREAGVNSDRKPTALHRIFKTLGPGLVTGASDDDPSGIGTYAAAGASYGYTTL